MDLCRRPLLRSLSEIKDLSVTNQIAPFVTSIFYIIYEIMDGDVLVTNQIVTINKAMHTAITRMFCEHQTYANFDHFATIKKAK